MSNRKRMTEVKAQTLQENKIGIASEVARAFIERDEIPQSETLALSYQMIPLEKLRRWEQQPRTFFDSSALHQLAKTIESEGFKYPLLVRPVEGGYEVVAGERRFLAAQLAQQKEVPCIVQTLDDPSALAEALTENLLREDLNPIEVLNSLLRLLTQQLNQSESDIINLLNRMKYQYEQSPQQDINILFQSDSTERLIIQVFERFGYQWYSYVCNQLKLRNLPADIYEAIATGQIEYSKGLRFKSVKDEALRGALLQQAISEGWTQKVIAEKLKADKDKTEEKSKSAKTSPNQQLTDLTSRLKKVQPWKRHPQVWKKIQSRLKGIEELLQELEEEITEDRIVDSPSDSGVN